MEKGGRPTMKLSVFHPFPQSLEITKCGDFTHSHRTTTTMHYEYNLALQKRRRFSFAPTEANYKCCIIRIEFNFVAARDLHSSQCKWWERLVGAVEGFQIRRGGEIVTRQTNCLP